MGGQACVLYGGAEFSRDIDFTFFVDNENLNNLKAFLKDLNAECIAVPPFEVEYLDKGHAVHFRSKHLDCFNLRIDLMTKMRGVDSFDELWSRRTTISYGSDLEIKVLSLQDLIKAKKTQRDKDWPIDLFRN